MPTRGHSIKVAPRNAALVTSPFAVAKDQSAARNIEELLPAPLETQSEVHNSQSKIESSFMLDTLSEYLSLLTDEEKRDLVFFFRHEQGGHQERALQAMRQHGETGKVEDLDRAIALLLHLRETQHGND